jgi:hypothetical protein
MTGGGGGITMTVHRTQYCSTSCVISIVFRQDVVGLIVTLFTGEPPRVWISTFRVVFSDEAVQVWETIATCVAALLPQVI